MLPNTNSTQVHVHQVQLGRWQGQGSIARNLASNRALIASDRTLIATSRTLIAIIRTLLAISHTRIAIIGTLFALQRFVPLEGFSRTHIAVLVFETASR
jgi:uncharacterized membrane protein YidH (DUF202 family)